LASGRLLAEGQSPRGTDPFSSTAADTFWVNHSWLWDVALYELHKHGGGEALVIAKAVLVAVLAGLFFCFRRRGTRMAALSFPAVVAILALGPWLQLQPILLSLLGVELTLYLLERPSLVERDRADRARSQRWLLVPLFALWANLDGWFVLGPILVGLYAVGEALRRVRSWWSLGLLTLAGLAACFLTPYHYRTFAWPTPLGLSPAEQALMRDPLGQGLVVSPFGARFAAAPVFASPGAWAYYLLLAAGPASFVLCGRAAHPGRLLVWLALAALSIYQARTIPFFAVAAGPILALNVQEWGRLKETRRQGDKETRRRVHLLVSLSPCLLVLLLVLAWPGWLQPRPWQPRGWTVEPNGSLVRLARRLETRHADQSFRPDRFALTFSPQAAHHLAWFCPAEKGFLDSRWPLFNREAEDFVRMRRCLLQSRTPGPDPELGPLLDAYHIDRIILCDPDWERTARAYTCLLLGRDEWEMLAVEGDAALFGRRSAAKSSSPWKAYDPQQAAYRPEPDHRAPLVAPRPPRTPTPFDAFYRARSGHSPDQGEAALHLIAFDLQAQIGRAELGAQWLLAQATGLIGSGTGSEAGGTACTLAVRLYLTPLIPAAAPAPVSAEGQQVAERFAAAFLDSHDTSPTESLLLTARAARRALSTNPEDARAYLVLGEAYLRLLNQPRAQPWQAALPELADIRRVQALTALEQAVLLRPDLDEAHALLADLYYRMNQRDRALDHLRARLRIAEQEAGKSGPDARAAAERQAGLSGDVEAMETLVRQSLDIYAANIAGKTVPSKVYDRARLASRHGLSRKALEMLLESYPAIFGKDGANLQLELMLQAGRAFEVRAWLEPEHEAMLGFRDYHWFQARAAAACGDYAVADAELDALSEQLRQVGLSREKLVPVRSAVAFRVGNAVLARPTRAGGPAALASALYFQFDALRPLSGPAGLLREEANMRTLRGLLALEPGAVETAREHFRAALNVWGDDARAAAGAGLDFSARPLAQEMNRLLEEAGEKK
jgi:hypothetical protein